MNAALNHQASHVTHTEQQLGGDVVLLFYKEYAVDRWVPGDRHLTRALRPAYNLVRRDQVVSGFYVWFSNLVKGLEMLGVRVETNNRSLAVRYPRQPVGLVGYPIILDGWNLPNPALLGPGMYDHPGIKPALMDDSRYQRYIVTCDWMENMFAPQFGSDRLVRWYGGLDIEEWPDTSNRPKQVDVLVYDKIRWNREHYVPNLLEPALAQLRSRRLTYKVITYGRYKHQVYRRALSESRMMLFLCEHETQGMAYQEALASNLPVLAWDQGFWLDPIRPLYDPEPVPAGSVPFFSAECGERFRTIEEFEPALERFLERRHHYRPRHFVETQLSLRGSASQYLGHYRSLLA